MNVEALIATRNVSLVNEVVADREQVVGKPDLEVRRRPVTALAAGGLGVRLEQVRPGVHLWIETLRHRESQEVST